MKLIEYKRNSNGVKTRLNKQLANHGFGCVMCEHDVSEDTLLEISNLLPGHIFQYGLTDERGITNICSNAKTPGNGYEGSRINKPKPMDWHPDGITAGNLLGKDDEGNIFLMEMPVTIILQHVQPAEEGGENSIFETTPLIEHITTEYPHLDKFCRDDVHSFARGKHASLNVPLIYTHEDMVESMLWNINYYLKPKDPKLRDLYKELKFVVDAFIENNPQLVHVIPMQRGLIIYMDNRTCWHSRLAFKGIRHVRRIQKSGKKVRYVEDNGLLTGCISDYRLHHQAVL